MSISNIDLLTKLINYTTTARDFCKSLTKVQLLITPDGLVTDHGCLAPVLATELRQGKLDQRLSDGFSSFEKPLRIETRLTKIDETLATSRKLKMIFRKRIEKRSVRLKISNSNSRKLQLFVLHEKPEAFCGKDNPDDTGRYLAKIEKFSILATRC